MTPLHTLKRSPPCTIVVQDTERLVASNEDLAENCITAAFGDAAAATARAAFVGLPPSDAQSCRTAVALRALLVAYLHPRAANSWLQLHAAWTWPGSFECNVGPGEAQLHGAVRDWTPTNTVL